jgi:hypothetical protein
MGVPRRRRMTFGAILLGPLFDGNENCHLFADICLTAPPTFYRA